MHAANHEAVMLFEQTTQRLNNIDTENLPVAANKIAVRQATPFLKWVGGKRGIIQELRAHLPKTYHNYFEPFVGGGALFFDTKPKAAFLSDANLDLVITYNVIKNEVEGLIELLKQHQRLHDEQYYYKLRNQHHLENPIEIAARMIYLNKTCFNGLWRVNKKGEFNVSMGKYLNPGICQEVTLRACHDALQSTVITHKDYKQITPQAGDFCYFDPPYHPVNKKSFTAYAEGSFLEKEQTELADFCKTLHERGVKVMLSNSNTDFIRKLYSSPAFKIAVIQAPRRINRKVGCRSAVEEALITNYQ